MVLVTEVVVVVVYIRSNSTGSIWLVVAGVVGARSKW